MKIGRKLAPMPPDIRDEHLIRFRKVKPMRPNVVRTGDNVRKCSYFSGTKKCLGSRCFWLRTGKCSIFKRKYGEYDPTNGNGVTGKLKVRKYK